MFLEHKEAGEVTEKPLDNGGRILLEAADIISLYGHAKGGYKVKGAFCAMGAIYEAGGREPDCRTPSIDSAIEKLLRAHGHRHIPKWNDAPERTKEEVIALLRSAARA